MPLQQSKNALIAALSGLHCRITGTAANNITAPPAENQRDDMARDRIRAEEFLGHILPHLDQLGVRVVEVDYDGENGNSNVVAIRAHRTFADTIDLEHTGAVSIPGHDEQDTIEYLAMHEAVGELAILLVEAEHPGFCKDLGSFGTVTIHVGIGTAELDHHQRHIHTTNHTAHFRAKKAGF